MSQTKVTDAVRTVTVVDGAKITTGTIPEARITALAATKLTGTVADARLPATALNSNVDLTTLSANNLTSGTIADARFPATLPAISGASLTGISSTTFAQAPVIHHQTGGGGTATDSTQNQIRYNGLTVDITPTSSSNKILIYFQQQQRIHHGGGGNAGYDAIHNQLQRGNSSTTIGASAALISGFGGTVTQIWNQNYNMWSYSTTDVETCIVAYWYLDSPATTSLCRYFSSISNTGRGENIRWKVDAGTSQMYAMEIKL